MADQNEQKPKLSFDELMEQLKDPALLQAAATRLGLQVGPPKGSEFVNLKRNWKNQSWKFLKMLLLRKLRS